MPPIWLSDKAGSRVSSAFDQSIDLSHQYFVGTHCDDLTYREFLFLSHQQ